MNNKKEERPIVPSPEDFDPDLSSDTGVEEFTDRIEGQQGWFKSVEEDREFAARFGFPSGEAFRAYMALYTRIGNVGMFAEGIKDADARGCVADLIDGIRDILVSIEDGRRILDASEATAKREDGPSFTFSTAIQRAKEKLSRGPKQK